EADLAAYLNNPKWCLQEKFDGKRLLIRRTAEGNIEGINRKGLIVAIPAHLEKVLSAICGEFLLDGEIVGSKYYCFDLLSFEYNGQVHDLRLMKYEERLANLSA